MLDYTITIIGLVTIFRILVNATYKNIIGLNETLPDDHNMLSAFGRNECIEVTLKASIFVFYSSMLWLSIGTYYFGVFKPVGEAMIFGVISAENTHLINNFVLPANGTILLYFVWILHGMNKRSNSPFMRKLEREKLLP